MTYTENLGTVKGDKGKVYIPRVEIDSNGYTWIKWDLVDNPNSDPAPIDISTYAYIPNISANGDITFTKQVVNETNKDFLINTTEARNIIGPRGYNGAIQIQPVPDNLTVEQFQSLDEYKTQGTIYMHRGGAYMYAEDGEYYYLDNLMYFETNFYEKPFVEDNYYNKTNIDDKLGNIAACQTEIINTLDKGINIPDGEQNGD